MVTEAMEVDEVIWDKSKKREEGVEISKTSQENLELTLLREDGW